MSDSFRTTIAELCNQITAKEAELVALKTTVNVLSRQIGEPDVYQTAGSIAGGAFMSPPAQSRKLRVDQYFGRPLATCVAELMENRKQVGEGPASIDEIFQTLKEGGYKFEGTTGSDENTKRAIKIALTKNTANFVKVRDDIFALKKWYHSKPRKARTNGEAKPCVEDELEPEEDPQLELSEDTIQDLDDTPQEDLQ